MANWKYRLEVGKDRAAFERNEIDIAELGKRFSAKIKALPCYGKEESQFSMTDEVGDCAREFEHVDDVEDFDNILEAFYDWADTPLDDAWPRSRICWVEPTSSL